MICPNCGSQCPDDANNCPSCGYVLNSSSNDSPLKGSVVGKNVAGITARNIAVAIILSLVTCGIYSIYWFVVLTNETNQLAEPDGTSGGMAFLLTLVTCGIYGWYWAFKLGEKVDKIKGNTNGSTNILFIILQIFGLGIVNYAIAQDAINKAL